MLTVESIPENLTHLRATVAERIKRLATPPPSFCTKDEWENGLKHFANQYQVDIFNMTPDQMILIDQRLAYWQG